MTSHATSAGHGYRAVRRRPVEQTQRAGHRRRDRHRQPGAAAADDPRPVRRDRRRRRTRTADLPGVPRRAGDGRVRRPRHAPRSPPRPRRRVPPRQAAGGVRLHRQPRDQPGHHPPARHLRLGPRRPAAVSDRRLRHRQIPPADRVWAPPPPRPGYRVRYTLASKLVNELVEAADDKPAVPDHRPLRPRRPARASTSWATWNWTAAAPNSSSRSSPNARNAPPIAIASNEAFCGWTKTFTDPTPLRRHRRPAHLRRHIIETGTTSYRLAHARAQRAARGAKSDRHPGARSS